MQITQMYLLDYKWQALKYWFNAFFSSGDLCPTSFSLSVSIDYTGTFISSIKIHLTSICQ